MKTIRLLVIIISSILCSCSTSIEPLDPSIVLPTAENPSPNPSPTPTWSNDAFPVNTSAILKVDVNGVTTIFGNIQGLKSITIPPLSTNEPPVIAYQIGGTIGTTFPLTNLNIQFLDEGIGTYPIELP